MKLLSRRTLVSGALFLLTGTGTASELVSGQIETELVRSPVEYYALLPPGYSTDAGPYPLVINLHGGGGDRERLKDQQSIWDEAVGREAHPADGRGHALGFEGEVSTSISRTARSSGRPS